MLSILCGWALMHDVCIHADTSCARHMLHSRPFTLFNASLLLPAPALHTCVAQTDTNPAHPLACTPNCRLVVGPGPGSLAVVCGGNLGQVGRSGAILAPEPSCVTFLPANAFTAAAPGTAAACYPSLPPPPSSSSPSDSNAHADGATQAAVRARPTDAGLPPAVGRHLRAVVSRALARAGAVLGEGGEVGGVAVSASTSEGLLVQVEQVTPDEREVRDSHLTFHTVTC